jgi:hypothetical protein
VKGTLNPVLVLGGGYDAVAEDASPPAASTMGKAVFVLDAITGTLLKTLPTTRSIPASVTLMDTDFDGYVDRAYAVDAGGYVYRIDFETGLGAGGAVNWTISLFANLSNGSTPRKFFYDADVVQTPQFTAVMVGTGKPRAAAAHDHRRPLVHAVRLHADEGADGPAGDPRRQRRAVRELRRREQSSRLLHRDECRRREGRHRHGIGRRQQLLRDQPADAAVGDELCVQSRSCQDLPGAALLRDAGHAAARGGGCRRRR